MNKKISFLCLVFCFTAGISHAKGKRPHVHKAPIAGSVLSELRAARWMLNSKVGNWMLTKNRVTAKKEIDEAINDISISSVNEDDNTGAHLPVDDRADTIGRMREAIEFLASAQNHIVHDKPAKFTGSLRSSVIKHIGIAKAALTKAIAAADRAEKQPIKKATPHGDHASNYLAYRHALYNLRAARWMLVHRPGNWQQATEEPEAVKQIEAAIYEITRVGIDDGKAMEDDPPVDEHPDHVSHIKAAYDFLRKAREDVANGEEDIHTRLLQGYVYTYIDEARRNVIIAEHIFTNDKPILLPVQRTCPLPVRLNGLVYNKWFE